MGTATMEAEVMEHPLKPQLRSNVRQALVQQIARRLDDEKLDETSVDTLSRITKETPVRRLMQAIYETSSVPKLSPKAAGRLVADVNKNRRRKAERIPVRTNTDD